MRWQVFLVPLVCCTLALGTAYAQEHGSGHSGSDQGGHEGGQGGKGGQGASGQHKGANPNCPYQDGSGRGGFRSAHEGKGGKHESNSGNHDSGDHTDHGTEHGEESPFLYGGVTAGGGAGGEGFVCDEPGNWHIDTKIFE